VDLGTIMRKAGDAYDASRPTTSQQRKVMRAVSRCRTPELGGHRDRCSKCGHEAIVFHSCRNRHCPRCQSEARAKWLEDRRKELLNVPYFHVVFTVPDKLNPLALHAPAVFYDLLFRAVAQTLLEIGASRMGARLGFLAVLHTWGQLLTLHPHIHCVVPGGGFSLDGQRWISSSPTFFLPVKVLSRRFRTVLSAMLQEAFDDGSLVLPDSVARDRTAFQLLLAGASHTDWVVYSKKPFGGPEQVLGYLAAYTHRIAISNRRIMDWDGERVTFSYKDYRNGNEQKTTSLETSEFMRRFLMHVVPPRFVRIRYYGFLANRSRAENIARARDLIGLEIPLPPGRPTTFRQCPECSDGTMIFLALLGLDFIIPEMIDTS